MMSVAAVPTSPEPAVPERCPELVNGDHLTRDEFERRYAAMPGVHKAELIEGVVFLPSPVNLKKHGNPHFSLVGWLAAYASATPGVTGADNSTLRLDLDNEPQPDALLMIDPNRGGQARLSEDGYLEGAPEFIAEVAASSVSYDLHEKQNAYRRSGVKEYLVWRVMDREIDWFLLRRGEYIGLEKGEDGLLKSETFPGLWLDSGALLNNDLATVLQRLQEEVESPEHQALVEKLQLPGSDGNVK